jgi:AmmeMemoRadiSam system protein B
MPIPHLDSHDRRPVVAGQFYPGDAAKLMAEVRGYLTRAGRQSETPTLLAMAPHAGYVYSGAVAGATLGQARLAQTVVLLGPNHTGLGKPYAVWPGGRWLFPGGALAVDEELAALLMQGEPRLKSDALAHAREHSLEVMLPFLAALDPDTRIVPICVAQPGLDTLCAVGRSMGQVLRGLGRPASILVSSDMSHYVTQQTARRQDSRALDPLLRLDVAAFYETVRAEGISMCGVLPMTVGITAALELGATKAEVAAYATSGDVSGDMERVVGYAGMLVS